jgi:hypothetical protein
MNYLETVNDVLIRLRENEVSSVNDTSYSKLIGKYVQDAQRQVEDSYNWNSLSETLSAVTVADLFNFVLVGAGVRFRLIDALNDTKNHFLQYKSTHEMNNLFLNSTPAKGSPMYYNFNGVSPEGDTQVDVYPIPDGPYDLRFNIIQPQDPLRFDSDELLIPSEPVIFLATAKALAERGEDGGMASSEMYALYKQSLSDFVSLEQNRYEEETAWYPI